MAKGLIFDFKRYAIHDGPGIRTTVFFKGCTLSCWWCHNPEGIAFRKELMVWPDRCIDCQICRATCPNSAISLLNNRIATERDKCKVCGACAAKCPTNAREIIGREMSVDEVVQEVEKDLPFYGESGGITISGGEPLAKPIFLHALLDKCKNKDIHTTLDTSGYAKEKILAKISNNVDLFLYDLKMMDDKSHKLYTGVSNKPIIKNLKLLDTLGKNSVIRFPLIPSVNSTKTNITAMCELVSGLRNVQSISILPYHKLGVDKAKRLGKEVKTFAKPSDRMLDQSLRLIKSYGFTVNVGG